MLFRSLENIKLKNVSLYPSNFTTRPASLFWANLNFQVIDEPEKRVWQFQGSGYTDQNSVEIVYTTKTPYRIVFEGSTSGTITTDEEVIDASQIVATSSSTGDDQTIIKIYIKNTKPLGNFGYNIFQKDDKPVPARWADAD